MFSILPLPFLFIQPMLVHRLKTSHDLLIEYMTYGVCMDLNPSYADLNASNKCVGFSLRDCRTPWGHAAGHLLLET